jgi:hypothetical protein
MTRLIGIVLAAAWLAGTAFGQAQPTAAEPDDNTLFLIHLDGPGLDADFAGGKAKPTQLEGAPPQFDEGPAGKALRVPGPVAVYDAKGNIDPMKGTIEFWVMDLDFDHASWPNRRMLFFCGGGGDGKQWYMDVMIERDWFYWRHLFFGMGGDRGVILHGDKARLPMGKWVRVTAGWDVAAGRATLLFNGREVARAQFKPEDVRDLTMLVGKYPPRQLFIGTERGKTPTALMDEFRISGDFRAIEAPAAREPVVLSQFGSGARSDYLPTRDAVTPHVPWAVPYHRGKTRVLVLENWERLRDVIELAQRFDIEYDVVPLKTDGGRRDTFGKMADYEKEMIAAKLAKNPDVLVLGALSPKWFPDDTWTLITTKVAGGMGLVWPGMDRAEARLVELFKNKVELPAFLKGGPPWTPMSSLFGNKPESAITAATSGQGRVAGIGSKDYHRRYSALIPSYYLGDEEYQFALLGRLVLWAAQREPEVTVLCQGDADGLPAMGGERQVNVLINSRRAEPMKGRLDIVLRDTSGAWDPFAVKRRGVIRVGIQSYPEIMRTTQEVTIAPGENKFSARVPGVPAGYYSVDAHLCDEQGRAVEWDSSHIRAVANPALRGLALDKDSYEPAETATCTAALEGDTKDVRLDWELRDAYGRVTLRGSAPVAAGTGKVETAFPVLVWNGGSRAQTLEVRVMRGEAMLQKAEKLFLVRLHRTREFAYLLYGGIEGRDAPLGFSAQVAGPSYSIDRRMAECDMDVFYWCSAPGWDAHGPRQTRVRKPCLTDPATLAAVDDFFGKIGPACLRHEPIGIILTDEWEYMSYRWAEEPGEDLCHSPTCLAAYREFLKKDYGTLEAVNREWGTEHKDWEEIEPVLAKDVVKRENKSPLIDAWRFNEWKIGEFLARTESAARKYYPAARVGLSGTRPADGRAGYDYWRIMSRSHMIQNYGGPMPRQSQSFQTPEHFVSLWFGYSSNFRETAGDLVWRSLAANFDAVTNYATFPDFGTYWPDYTPTPATKAIADAYAETQRGIAPLLKGARRVTDPIAIHYSQVSAHIAELGLVPKVRRQSFDANLTSLCQLLTDSGYQFRYVSYEEIEQGVLQKEGFRLLVLPMSTAISDREAAQMRAFVEGGGTLFADGFAGLYDGHGKVRDKGALDEFMGIARAKVASDQSLQPLELGPGLQPVGRTVGGQKALRAETGISVAGGEALGSFGAESPAFILKKNGTGRTLFANALFSDYEVFRAGGAGGEVGTVVRSKGERRTNAQALFQGIVALAGLKPAVVVENATPVDQPVLNTEIVRYLDGAAEYVLVQAGGLRALTLKDRARNDVTVRFPRRAAIYDVRRGGFLGISDSAQGTLVEGEPLIFALLPGRVEAVAVTADKAEYARGGVVKLSVFANEQRGVAPHRRVFHIEFTDGQGRPQPAHRANVTAPAGWAVVTTQLALNAAPGEWRCVATDTASGMKGEARFVVK